MRTKKMKQISMVLLSVALIGMVGDGCGSTQSKTQGQTDTEVQQDTQKMEEEKGGEREKLVIGIQTNTFVTDYDDNYLTNKLEKDLGMEIEFYLLPNNPEDVRTKMSLMATNGEDIPDVILTFGAVTQEMILEFGNKGIFIPLNTYLEDTTLCPNFNAIAKEDMEVIMDTIVSADGNIYGLPKYEPTTWNETPYRYWINQAWLDQLGLTVPKTMDELHDVLTAFVNEDPNGNGVKDEIGIYGYTKGGYGENILTALMNSFVFYNGGAQNGGLALDESGETVIAPFVTDEWREGLKVLNQWFQEGLIAPSVFTDDATQYKATLNSDTNIVGLATVGSHTGNWPDFDNNKNAKEMEMIPPFEGPSGICYTPYNSYTPSIDFFITSACKNPKLAMKLADYMYSEEISYIVRHGEEGVGWTNDPEICKQYTNSYKELGITDEIDVVFNYNTDLKIWAEPSNVFWHNVGPRYFPMEKGNAQADGSVPFDPEVRSTQTEGWNYKYYHGKHPDQILPLLKYTLEESNEIAMVVTDIDEFIDTSMAEFITGQRTLDDTGWESYLNELNGLGLESWLNIAQTSYERSK